VLWRDLPIGRILKQPGVPMGRPNWHWVVTFPGRPQPTGDRGNCSVMDECKRRFKAVWSGIRDGLSAVDIEAARRIETEAERRTVKMAQLMPSCVPALVALGCTHALWSAGISIMRILEIAVLCVALGACASSTI
jgi:hypothetical protein